MEAEMLICLFWRVLICRPVPRGLMCMSGKETRRISDKRPSPPPTTDSHQSQGNAPCPSLPFDNLPPFRPSLSNASLPQARTRHLPRPPIAVTFSAGPSTILGSDVDEQPTRRPKTDVCSIAAASARHLGAARQSRDGPMIHTDLRRKSVRPARLSNDWEFHCAERVPRLPRRAVCSRTAPATPAARVPATASARKPRCHRGAGCVRAINCILLRISPGIYGTSVAAG
ncbi:hypothetical protein EVG20_g10079, partial [Dentipellis fragilis]